VKLLTVKFLHSVHKCLILQSVTDTVTNVEILLTRKLIEREAYLTCQQNRPRGRVACG
jgi:hypothetical protein